MDKSDFDKLRALYRLSAERSPKGPGKQEWETMLSDFVKAQLEDQGAYDPVALMELTSLLLIEWKQADQAYQVAQTELATTGKIVKIDELAAEAIRVLRDPYAGASEMKKAIEHAGAIVDAKGFFGVDNMYTFRIKPGTKTVWRVRFEGETFTPKGNLQGYKFIRFLLANPEQTFYADKMVPYLRDAAGPPDPIESNLAIVEQRRTRGRLDDNIPLASYSPEFIGDARQKKEVRERFEHLSKVKNERLLPAIDQAKINKRPRELADLEGQLAGVQKELDGLATLGKELYRKVITKQERSRSNLSNQFTLALGRITAHDTKMGQHLRQYMDGRTRCSYFPPKPITWTTK